MADNHEATGEEKLLLLSHQLDTMTRVGPIDIECPYCGKITSPGKQFCCGMIVRALGALQDAREKFGHLESHLRN